MVTEPSSEAGLIEISTRQRHDNDNDLFLGGVNAEAVQTEEEIHGLEGHAFVPIHEGVVIGKTEAICSSESGKIRIWVVMIAVEGSFEGRFQETTVAESERAPVSLDLIGVDRQDVYDGKPARFDHLASSRMALR